MAFARLVARLDELLQLCRELALQLDARSALARAELSLLQARAQRELAAAELLAALGQIREIGR